MGGYHLLKNVTADEADMYGLVLSSSDIPYNVSKGEHGWNIYVPAAAYEKALKAIEAYLEENQDAQPKQETISFEYGKTYAGIWASLILLALHVGTVTGYDTRALIKTYGSAAHHILEGEWYRTVTSLMIHVNALHLAGNMFGIALFATAICQIVGPGVGWLIILITGISGNFMNALLYQRDHLSVGSSTAIFGAIGILAGYQSLKRFRRTHVKTKAWLPLGAGVALLAFLGSSKYSDLTAHLFGFLAGIVVGVLYGSFVRRPAGKVYQICFVLLTLSVIVVSWTSAIGVF